MVNGKQYVGQTIRKDIEERWNEHKSCGKRTSGIYLSNAFYKYGIQNFKFQIICICFDEACNDLEIDYIKKFNTLSPIGYNIESGGGNSACHPDTKKKLSEIFKGRKMSKEQRDKISKRMTGIKRKPFTDEWKQNISLARKKLLDNKREDGSYKTFVKKGGLNSGMFRKGKNNPYDNRRVVGKYDKDGNLLETFDSTVDAALNVGTSQSNISRVCNGNKYCKTANGYIWKFI